MWLTRLRGWFKNALSRDSIPYRLARAIYRVLLKVQNSLFPKKQAARTITDNSIFLLEEEMEMCSIFPKEILDLMLDYALRWIVTNKPLKEMLWHLHYPSLRRAVREVCENNWFIHAAGAKRDLIKASRCLENLPQR